MKKILVTGSGSFLGQHVVPLLKSVTGFEVLTPRRDELDLFDRAQTKTYLRRHQPDTILHMAALCGGIGANKNSPAMFLQRNVEMTMNLFEGVLFTNRYNDSVPYFRGFEPIQRVYGLGSVCMYPKFTPVPFKEENIWNGMPEETNFPYGESKRVLLVMQQAYRKQFGLRGAHLVPVNMYGEHDHFDLENSHVIPALIRKFVEARDFDIPSVEVWGNGEATREFLYAGDCAKAIVKAVTTSLDYNEPINLGTGVDISIKRLAEKIKNLTGYNGQITFTGDVVINGQPARRLDVSRAKEVLDWQAEIDLDNGLYKTIHWFEKNLKEQRVHT
jgi:nucleoside-diphosphate-sugar epimerase